MNTDFHTIEFDRPLIESLPASGPRYTSYPTADRFYSPWNETDLISTLQHTHQQPLSLYVHIPFCNTICYYCGCNKIITKDKNRADVYLDYLAKELALWTQNWPSKPLLAQLHLGGGTPTFLNDQQFSRLFDSIQHYFTLITDGEYSIEIDPRKVSTDSVAHLGNLGFNRMSVGIQDFNPAVQKAVNRIQTEAETRQVIEAARAHGFNSISVDLIYGLPHQTQASMHTTIEHVLSLDPDRIAMYHYAHLPHLFKPQRRIDTTVVPNSSIKLDILQDTVQHLLNNGYMFIGMDHFAKPEDELAQALIAGRLQRNFQGYSTHAECDLIAIGVSSISKIGNIYSQNEKDLTAYYQALDEQRLPLMRGYRLHADDELRRTIIQDLMCHFHLDFSQYALPDHMSFTQYFAAELVDLQQLAKLGLLKLSSTQLQVIPKGRFLIRNIAMVFDIYLRQKRTGAQYSQTI